MEYFPYNPLKKVVYKERFGVMLELGGLYRTVLYNHVMEGDYRSVFGIINS